LAPDSASKEDAEGEDPAKLPLVGLALSGGGIRSATFCLGVLQMLARKRVLRLVDYLCSVSGGGYIGACLTSLMTLPKTKRDEAPRQWKEEKEFDLDHGMPLLETQQVHHLRKHGDFLILRRGLFRREVLRAIGTIGLGLACTMGLFLSLVVLAVAGLLLYGVFFGPAADGTTIWDAVRAAGTSEDWEG
jgi:predicted acylesterase/phospholipase RssA